MSQVLSMPAAQYHAAAGVSKSDLDNIAHPLTPAHFKYRVIDKGEREETEAMRFGSIIHRVTLEPETCADAFAVKPDGFDGRTKDGKAFIAANADKTILTAEQSKAIEGIKIAVHSHPTARRLLKNGEAEQSLFAKDGYGTLRKCRIDYLPKTGNVLVDLKTTADASPDEFAKAIYNYRYHVQAAYYLDLCKLVGIDKAAFIIIAVEKSAPFNVACYEVEAEAVNYGRLLYQRDLTLYRHCLETNNWPGYGDGIESISLPAFARKEMEQAA